MIHRKRVAVNTGSGEKLNQVAAFANISHSTQSPSSPMRRNGSSSSPTMSLGNNHSSNGHYNKVHKRLFSSVSRKQIIGLTIALLLFLVLCTSNAMGLGMFSNTVSSSDESSPSSIQLPKQLSKHTNLNEVNRKLKTMNLGQVLNWAHSIVDPLELVDVTSFGPSGMVILFELHRLGLTATVPIVTIDTLHLFPETRDFIHSFVHGDQPIFGKDIRLSMFKPENMASKTDFDETYGADLYKENPERYAYLSKVEPLSRALYHYKAKIWITGRRQSQGGERSNLPILELDDSSLEADGKGGGTRGSSSSKKAPGLRFKLNPLAYWSYDQVWEYIRENNVPYNPLHDQGYKSIGDIMTTIKVDASASERSGRFVGMDQTECGIHSTRAKMQKIKDQVSEDHPLTDLDQSAPLPCTGCLELNPDSLDEIVKEGTNDLLVEFHSPLCGHCRAFAPKFDQVAIKLHEMYPADIQVARFDITYTDVPKASQELGMQIEVTPTIFLVKRLPKFQLLKYSGRQSPAALLAWLKAETDYVK